MATLTTILSGVFIKHAAKTLFDTGIDADLAEASGKWAAGKLSKRRATSVEHFAQTAAQAATDDLRDFLTVEKASAGEIDSLEIVLAGALGRIDPATALVDAGFDEAKLAETIYAAALKGSGQTIDSGHLQKGTGRLAAKLTKIGTDLDGYANASEAKKLEALHDLTTAMAGVIESQSRIEDKIDQGLSKEDREREEYGQRYRAQVAKDLDYVEILGLSDVDRGVREAKLSVAYLSLTMSGVQQKGFPREFDSILGKAILRRERLLIEGGAGSGKSTLMKWGAIIARDCELNVRTDLYGIKITNEHEVEKNSYTTVKTPNSLYRTKVFHPSLTDIDGFIPFLIRLRQFTDGELPSMEKWPQNLCKTLDVSPPGFVAKVLESGRAAIFFDGIDEVPEGAAREKALRTIDGYARDYPLVPILIASRPGAFDLKDYDNLHDAVVHTIDDMSAAQRARFIGNLHKARAVSRHAVDGLNYTALGQKLIKRTEAFPPLARIATNPLLCAAICALHEIYDDETPKDERGLCERLTMMLLVRDGKTGKTDPVILEKFGPEYVLPKEQRKQLLAFIAHRMIARGRSQLDLADAAALMPRALKRIGVEGLDPDTMMKALAERSPPLRPASSADGGAAVEFVHNRFKEWLASTWFISEEEHEELVRHAEKEDYAETLVMAAAAPDRRKFAEALVAGIMDRAEAETENKAKRTMRVLALRAALVAPDLSEKLRDRAAKLQKTLLPPRTMAEARALALAGDAVVDRLKQRATPREAKQSARCIRCLTLIGTPKAKAAVKGYRRDHRFDVLRELVRVFDGADLPALWVADAEGMIAPPKEFRPYITRIPELPSNTKGLLLGQNQGSGTPSPAAPISDLSPLSDLKALEGLYLSGTSISDLTPLSGLNSLERLYLSKTPVSDLSPLSGLTALEVLHLNETPVEDVLPLRGLKELKILWLHDTSVTDLSPLDGIRRLEVIGNDSRPEKQSEKALRQQ